jgi:RNA polymerase sigma factor (sigma-70 family)
VTADPLARADAELLRTTAAGDEEAFLEIYRRYQGRVYRFAFRMTGSPDAARDVTQSCFASLLQAPLRYQQRRADLGTYLCAAARNQNLRYARRTWRAARLADPEVVVEPGQAELLVQLARSLYGIRQAPPGPSLPRIEVVAPTLLRSRFPSHRPWTYPHTERNGRRSRTNGRPCTTRSERRAEDEVMKQEVRTWTSMTSILLGLSMTTFAQESKDAKPAGPRLRVHFVETRQHGDKTMSSRPYVLMLHADDKPARSSSEPRSRSPRATRGPLPSS